MLLVNKVQAALDIAGAREPTPAIVLREGTHYLTDTLHLGPEHSGLL